MSDEEPMSAAEIQADHDGRMTYNLQNLIAWADTLINISACDGEINPRSMLLIGEAIKDIARECARELDLDLHKK